MYSCHAEIFVVALVVRRPTVKKALHKTPPLLSLLLLMLLLMEMQFKQYVLDELIVSSLSSIVKKCYKNTATTAAQHC